MAGAEHAPGTFCWVELMTSDPAGAKTFYETIMGWKTVDHSVPDGAAYTMIKVEEGNVGGLFALLPELKQMGVPSHWGSYILVEDAAACVERAKELGATVHREVFDVMDEGVMAVIMDPTGGVVNIWQAKKHTGYDFTDGRPGTVCWYELTSTDTDRAGKFYTDLFGWGTQVEQMGDTAYTMFLHGEKPVAGMMAQPPEMKGTPSVWMPYFAVSDCDGTTEKATGLGAKVHVPPTDIPNIGRFAVIQDPQGAAFAYIQEAPKA
jgi:predicted enzyme related to lactoylglutathione lyase